MIRELIATAYAVYFYSPDGESYWSVSATCREEAVRIAEEEKAASVARVKRYRDGWADYEIVWP